MAQWHVYRETGGLNQALRAMSISENVRVPTVQNSHGLGRPNGQINDGPRCPSVQISSNNGVLNSNYNHPQLFPTVQNSHGLGRPNGQIDGPCCPSVQNNGLSRRNAYKKRQGFIAKRGRKRLNGKQHITCFNCKGQGHTSRVCPSKNVTRQSVQQERKFKSRKDVQLKFFL